MPTHEKHMKGMPKPPMMDEMMPPKPKGKKKGKVKGKGKGVKK